MQITNIKHHSGNIITFTIEINWLPGIDTGWGNGYIGVPAGHPLYGTDYNNLYGTKWELTDQEWTYSGGEELENAEGVKENYWVFGFDSAHAYMDRYNWSERRVVQTIEDAVALFQPKQLVDSDEI